MRFIWPAGFSCLPQGLPGGGEGGAEFFVEGDVLGGDGDVVGAIVLLFFVDVPWIVIREAQGRG